MWLLDTNIWIRYLLTEPGRVAQKIAQTNPEQLFMCDVVKLNYCLEPTKVNVWMPIWPGCRLCSV